MTSQSRMESHRLPTPFSLTYTLSWHMLLDQFSYVGNRARYRFIELDMSTELDWTHNWNMLAKQVSQLARGYWTAPFVAAPFLIYAYAYLQISFRLDDNLVMHLLGCRFCASFPLVVFLFHSRPNGRNINARSSFSITHCQTPVRKLVSGGLTKMELSFKLLDTLNFSLSLLSYGHFLSFYFKHAWICCHNCSLMNSRKKTSP